MIVESVVKYDAVLVARSQGRDTVKFIKRITTDVRCIRRLETWIN